MVYLSIHQESNVAGGYVTRRFLSIGNSKIPFVSHESESIDDIWERWQHVMTEKPDKFQEILVTADSDAVTLDQMLLNAVAGGRRLDAIHCLILDQAGRPIEYSSYVSLDCVQRKGAIL